MRRDALRVQPWKPKWKTRKSKPKNARAAASGPATINTVSGGFKKWRPKFLVECYALKSIHEIGSSLGAEVV